MAVRGQYFQKLKQAEVSSRESQSSCRFADSRSLGARRESWHPERDGRRRSVHASRAESFGFAQGAIGCNSGRRRIGPRRSSERSTSPSTGNYRRTLTGSWKAQAKNLGVEDQWRQANAGWRDYQTKFNNPQSPLYQVANQADPAKVTRRLLNKWLSLRRATDAERGNGFCN